MKISQAISRTTGPNKGLFVLILMHFSCWSQIWLFSTIFNNFENWKKFLKKNKDIVCTRCPRGDIRMDLKYGLSYHFIATIQHVMAFELESSRVNCFCQVGWWEKTSIIIEMSLSSRPTRWMHGRTLYLGNNLLKAVNSQIQTIIGFSELF